MADLREQIEEIKALLSSQSKAFAYTKLLRFQEMSAIEPPVVDILVGSSRTIIGSVVLDISDDDEEMYVYHSPSVFVF